MNTFQYIYLNNRDMLNACQPNHDRLYVFIGTVVLIGIMVSYFIECVIKQTC